MSDTFVIFTQDYHAIFEKKCLRIIKEKYFLDGLEMRNFIGFNNMCVSTVSLKKRVISNMK